LKLNKALLVLLHMYVRKLYLYKHLQSTESAHLEIYEVTIKRLVVDRDVTYLPLKA